MADLRRDGGNMSDGTMRSELLELQMQANVVTDESLESTRRMVKLCDECVDAGGKTVEMLAEQGEQLDRIENGMGHINQDMKHAEKNLEDLERCCGLFVLPWKRARQFEKSGDYTKTWKSSDDGKVNTIGPRVGDRDPSGGKATGGFITRITNDAREDEMDRNLGEVDDMVGMLHDMAVDIGNELDSQNVQLGRMNEKCGSLTDRVNDAKTRANKILHD